MFKTSYDKLMGIVRGVVATVGGALIGAGITTEVDWSGVIENINTIAGAVTALAAIGASIYAKVGKKIVDAKAVIAQSPDPKDYSK